MTSYTANRHPPAVIFGADKFMRVKPNGPTPRDVLLANMWFHWERVERTGRKLQRMECYNQGTPGEIQALKTRHLEARAAAHQCAIDAAPYVHPKLGVMKVKIDDRSPATLTNEELINALTSLSDEELGSPVVDSELEPSSS